MATARVVAGGAWHSTSRAVLLAALGGVATVALALLVIGPLLALVATGVVEGSRASTREPLAALARTLMLAAVSTTVSVLLATVVAHASFRIDVRGGAVAHRLLSLALVLPPFLPGLGVLLLSRGRVGFGALVAAQVLSVLPYAYVALGHAMAAVHPDQEDAAESLGARRARILTRITLVLLWPGLVSAAVGVFLLCLADVVNPLLVGGDYTVLTTVIYVAARNGGDPGRAVALALWLLAPSLVVAAIGRWRAGVIFEMPHVQRRMHRAVPRRVHTVLTGVVASVAVALLGVYASVVAGAVPMLSGRDRSPGIPHGATVAELVRVFGGSVAVGAAAAVTGTVLAVLVAGLVRRSATGDGLLQRVARLPAALPALVLGIGFLFAYARPLAFGAGFATFVAAAVAVRLPTTVPAAVGAVRRIDVDLVTVALSLGAGRRRALSRVLFPLLTPVTVSLLVFLFVRTLVTVSVLLPLAGPRPALASVAAIDASLAGRPAEACALAVMLSVVVLVIVGLRRVLAGREHAAVWFV